jgi:hypothetical protein
MKITIVCTCGKTVTEKDIEAILVTARVNNGSIPEVARHIGALFDKAEV